MNCCTNSFPRPKYLVYFTFLIAVVALPGLAISAQTPVAEGTFQKISLKTKGSCAVPASGEVTSLVKNNVELSVTEDFDCDGVPDAYDNCVGMPNRDQADTDHNGIGDVCEAATLIKAGPPSKSKPSPRAKAPAKGRPNKKDNRRKAIASDKRWRQTAKRR